MKENETKQLIDERYRNRTFHELILRARFACQDYLDTVLSSSHGSASLGDALKSLCGKLGIPVTDSKDDNTFRILVSTKNEWGFLVAFKLNSDRSGLAMDSPDGAVNLSQYFSFTFGADSTEEADEQLKLELTRLLQARAFAVVERKLTCLVCPHVIIMLKSRTNKCMHKCNSSEKLRVSAAQFNSSFSSPSF